MSEGRGPGAVVAIVGATGAVGIELIRCLEERAFPLAELRLFASARSAGKTLRFRGRELPVRELTEDSFEGVQLALFSAGSGTSKRFAPLAVRAGATVIDNSSAFRLDPQVPLVVPEINPETLRGHRGIIANPNCCAIISITPLWPIHRVNRIRRLQLATYQAASGAGAAAMEELRESTRAYLEGRTYEPRVLPHPYAFNLFSHNTRIDPATGYNDEETKVIQETRKIFGDGEIRVSATCVRVPVLRAHSMAITFECSQPITPARVRELLREAPGVKLVDDAERNYFPMPKDASGQDAILVGRIRNDISDPDGRSISLFVAGDQLLKGAALNAVQIAEALRTG
ncbi:MAG: aspartate-semialdehyde dehydrogenase [Gammaproteobacteria bacterium 13_2_20CM_66_19]|nr:MAG: aspartate-semialdehyde dehydrogenase [Gammaproteobacteria bacterium 13_2_20CM_66_19]TLY65899.1 MAG: aspartate-semialdehyde dehydrogenase [Gammaproteobacteria bacterium]TLZ09822.1 MAG: aspartate-semialdehyde dehydrogenase [Gammaproteobacteria bacterium]